MKTIDISKYTTVIGLIPSFSLQLSTRSLNNNQGECKKMHICQSITDTASKNGQNCAKIMNDVAQQRELLNRNITIDQNEVMQC